MSGLAGSSSGRWPAGPQPREACTSLDAARDKAHRQSAARTADRQECAVIAQAWRDAPAAAFAERLQHLLHLRSARFMPSHGCTPPPNGVHAAACLRGARPTGMKRPGWKRSGSSRQRAPRNAHRFRSRYRSLVSPRLAATALDAQGQDARHRAVPGLGLGIRNGSGRSPRRQVVPLSREAKFVVNQWRKHCDPVRARSAPSPGASHG